MDFGIDVEDLPSLPSTLSELSVKETLTSSLIIIGFFASLDIIN